MIPGDENYEDGLNHPFFPPCNTCKHYKIGSNPPSCAAFRFIPDSILTGEVGHEEPVDGDNGIQWESIDG